MFEKPEWSDWMQLSGLSVKDIPGTPGAYVIATRANINRAAGTDPVGILDIGESTDLKNRIASFMGCASGKHKAGHMAGWRYFSFKLYELFPFDKLWVRWIATNTKEDAYSAEGSLFGSYIKQYKELPPLNYKFNWSENAP